MVYMYIYTYMYLQYIYIYYICITPSRNCTESMLKQLIVARNGTAIVASKTADFSSPKNR